ncbi:MAG: hypothetical protein QMB55_08490 [Propionivibrio sp.]
MLDTNGTIAATAPAPPTAAVATIRRLLPQSILPSLLIAPILRTNLSDFETISEALYAMRPRN